MPAKSYLGLHKKELKMIKILKWPNFVKVIKKKSPYSYFKERQLQEMLQFHFHKINYIDKNFNCD